MIQKTVTKIAATSLRPRLCLERKLSKLVPGVLGLLLILPIVAFPGVFACRADPPKISIRLAQDSASPQDSTFVVEGLSPSILKKLGAVHWSTEKWSRLLSVYVAADDPTKKSRLAILGSHVVQKDTLIFRPRFPLQPGLRYKAVFDPSGLPEAKAKGDTITATIVLPLEKPKETTAVAHVYPSTNRLPENQLKFYLHFTAPMSRGEAYRHIHLVEASGKKVDMPFLELDEELWDSQGKRFTLFFDPGRIKRGLKPREEVGTALEEGKSYTLVIDRTWPDARGNPLRETFRKTFQAGPPDDQPPDPKSWKMEDPPTGTTKPLIVRFPKPLEHALLGRLIWVTDATEIRVEGKAVIKEQETQWQFTPAQPWAAGPYNLVVDTTLEDLAGNSIGRPFELDVFHPVEAKTRPKTITIPIVTAHDR